MGFIITVFENVHCALVILLMPAQISKKLLMSLLLRSYFKWRTSENKCMAVCDNFIPTCRWMKM